MSVSCTLLNKHFFLLIKLHLCDTKFTDVVVDKAEGEAVDDIYAWFTTSLAVFVSSCPYAEY